MHRDITINGHTREIHVGGRLSKLTWKKGTKDMTEALAEQYFALDIREEMTTLLVDQITVEFNLNTEEIERATEVIREGLILFET